MHLQPAILHAQNTYNNGSFMMLINLIWYFVKQSPEQDRITFWVEQDGKENFKRLMEALPGELYDKGRVEIRQLPLKITSIDNSSAIRKLFRLFGKFYRHPKIFRKLGINSVIILGGDDISEYYKKWMILSDLYRIRRYSRRFQTILAGQTIGPFNGLRERAAARCLSGVRIFSRDELSFSYLKKQLKLTEGQIHSSADLCFPDLPGQEKAHSILDEYGLKAGQYFTIVPGGFYKLYTDDRSAYIQAWVHFMKKLLGSPSSRGKRVVLLPHVTRPEDDRKMIGAIQRTLIKEGQDPHRLCAIDKELLPQQLRQILGSGRFTISSRMHAALSTFQMKKPAIALGYSVKYQGVIGRSLGCPELVLPCSEELLGNAEKFAGELLHKSNYIEENYGQLTAHLGTVIPRLQDQARAQVSEICSMLIKGS
jgi:colanic acid/amylovoran biosynthesis protein